MAGIAPCQARAEEDRPRTAPATGATGAAAARATKANKRPGRLKHGKTPMKNGRNHQLVQDFATIQVSRSVF